MSDRSRLHVGRNVTYLPTDAEAATGNGNAGDQWAAVITAVLANGTVNLFVYEADGTAIAKTGVSRGGSKGSFDVIGLLAS
ncbi:MAG TPA: hypothetical protein VIK52_01625 [Opitutaceae bacterium]